MREHFDAIVIGAGAMGSAAAYYLSKRGQRVLLLEQFEIDHRKGSSYGYSRIIRYSYDHSEYVELMKDTFPLWFALEDELGETLYHQTGGISFGPADDKSLQATIKALESGGIDYELLSIEDAQERFPQFRFWSDFKVLYQPDSGFITASKAVRGHITLARQLGAVVKESAPVDQIQVNSNSVDLFAAGERYSASHLIVTAGSWARSLLQETGLDLPLTTLRCQLNFMSPADWRPYESERCPVWGAHVSDRFRETVYGIPAHDGSGFKIAFHGGAAARHPSEIDYSPDANNVEALRPFMQAHIPGIADSPARESRICLYTQTPDKHFIIDSHPSHKHVAIGAGFSGHGFKFSTMVGKMLTDIALDGGTPHNDRLFKISRFAD
ncbi:MAG: N-methyl-L-tryptophan oxidase [Chloroflexota bacterium]|nr:N-methyl-L-tryptophan oxidase [Chloroflexota bacterium]MDE2909398.1 N-methyl-L-tryptophan oxidase [Chloroflexota bacterium]